MERSTSSRRGIGWAVLLLDEHTAALDPQSADQVVRLTHDIIERDKLTTLMVTHSMQSERNRAR